MPLREVGPRASCIAVLPDSEQAENTEIWAFALQSDSDSDPGLRRFVNNAQIPAQRRSFFRSHAPALSIH